VTSKQLFHKLKKSLQLLKIHNVKDHEMQMNCDVIERDKKAFY